MALIRFTPSGLSSSIREIARAMARGSPASTLSTRGDIGSQADMDSSLSLQQLPGDHEALNLARALANRGQLHVAKVLLGRIVFHEPVAAVDLNAVIGCFHGDFARIELRYGRLERRPAAVISQVRGAIGQQSRSLDSRGVVGQL